MHNELSLCLESLELNTHFMSATKVKLVSTLRSDIDLQKNFTRKAGFISYP